MSHESESRDHRETEGEGREYGGRVGGEGEVGTVGSRLMISILFGVFVAVLVVAAVALFLVLILETWDMLLF